MIYLFEYHSNMFLRRYKLKKAYLISVIDEDSGAYTFDRICMHKCDAFHRKDFIEQQGLSAAVEEVMIEVDQ